MTRGRKHGVMTHAHVASMNPPNMSICIRRTAVLLALLVAASATSVVSKAAEYDAAFVTQVVNPPSHFIELYTPTAVSVTMRNTGTATWYEADHDVFLATAEPQDNYYWCIQDNLYGIWSDNLIGGTNRVPLPHDVAPGEEVQFDFVVKPLGCFFRATSPFRFRMLSPTHGTFGEETPDPGVSVSVAAQFVSQQVPAVVPAGATFQVTVTFKNTTKTSWTPEDTYALVPVGGATWGVVSVPLTETVAPGATVTFTFHAVAPETTGSAKFQWQMSSAANTTFGQASAAAMVQIVAAGPPNYGGLWWASPAGSESGWGMNLTHQRDVVFVTWFTYDATGNALWVSMTANLSKNGSYVGMLVQSTGPWFHDSPFVPRQVRYTNVGTGILTFTDANNATFLYTLLGVSQTKQITRQVFGTLPTCTFNLYADLTKAYNYQDLWWAAPAASEPGWGVNLTHQDDTIFAAWFTYDVGGTPLWLTVTAPKTAPGAYGGVLNRTTGPAFSAVPFDPGKIVSREVGSATFTFTNGNAGTFAYSVDGIVGSKAITRQILVPPGTVCQ